MSMVPALPPPPVATTLPPGEVARVWKAAQEFEAMAAGQMLQPMFDTLDTAHGLFGGGEGEAAWTPMLVQEFGRQIARHGGLGLARPVFAEMLRMQEGRNGLAGASP